MSNPRVPFALSSSLPPLPALDGGRILAHVVVNVEAWGFDNPVPRKLLGSPHGKDQVPDVPNFSWVEYGMRAGLPRILDALARRGLPASASLGAQVIEEYPDAASAIKDAGWEIIGHGVTQRSLPSHDDEAAVIDQTLGMIEDYYGTRPRGWLGPGLAESTATPDHLSAAGIEYVCDWVVDDVPVWLRAEPRPLVAVPYTLELNDSVLYAVQWHPARELEVRAIDTLARYRAEAETAPRVLSLGLHPHLVGVPHRIDVLERILDALCQDDGVRFVTGSGINDWFRAAHPNPGS